MRYFVGCLITGEAARFYEELTAKLANSFDIENLSNRLPPHVTLKPPFDSEDVEPLKKLLKEIAANVKRLPMEIEGFGRFGHRTVFLDIKPESALNNLAEKVVNVLEAYRVEENRNFLPRPIRLHVSVARFLFPDQSEKIWQYLSALPVPHFTLQFDNITLFHHDGSRWQVAEEYPIE